MKSEHKRDCVCAACEDYRDDLVELRKLRAENVALRRRLKEIREALELVMQ